MNQYVSKTHVVGGLQQGAACSGSSGVTSTAFSALWLLVASSPEDIKSAAEVGRKTDQDHFGS